VEGVVKRLRSQTSAKERPNPLEIERLKPSSPQAQFAHPQHLHSLCSESIDNLYTMKKIKSKVHDKVIHWIDFSTTAATLNREET